MPTQEMPPATSWQARRRDEEGAARKAEASAEEALTVAIMLRHRLKLAERREKFLIHLLRQGRSVDDAVWVVEKVFGGR